MNKYKILIVLYFLLVCYSMPAESFFDENDDGKTAFISGKISDDKVRGENYVRYANVCLINGRDSVWTTTSSLGVFNSQNMSLTILQKRFFRRLNRYVTRWMTGIHLC